MKSLPQIHADEMREKLREGRAKMTTDEMLSILEKKLAKLDKELAAIRASVEGLRRVL